MSLSAAQQTALDWIEAHKDEISGWHKTIWDFHEPAWREYKSAAWYVERLRAEGFAVEEGSGAMPTAFCARWGDDGPVIGGYAEYDAVPGNSQDPVPRQQPRQGVHRWAAGHTDPHSSLGIGSLVGVLAAKAAMEAHGIKGSLKFMGEPAEKVCGSKPVHAAKGYYDDMDAAVVWHPSYGHRQVNTPMLETHCGSYWSKIYTFECVEPETWSGMAMGGRGSSHTVARAPGANDALCLMYTTTKYTKEAMLPRSGTWTLNEAILGGGQATSDNLPPRFAQIQYSWRSPRLDMQERIAGVLDNNAEHVAAIAHCQVRSAWVTKTRVGLANQALARLAYKNLEQVGPPAFGEEARSFAREIQQNLGFEPMDEPLADEILGLMTPEEGEQRVRDALPPWQLNYTSDDYVDYTWQTPTVRLMIGRATLRSPRPDYQYPAWVWNALGGYPAAIDPTTFCAGRVIAATVLDLLTDGTSLAAVKAEFEERTGGGRGGSKWVAPLLPADFAPPVGFRWPEYVSTIRGDEWWIPETA